jgi:hypothetical protein
MISNRRIKRGHNRINEKFAYKILALQKNNHPNPNRLLKIISNKK